MYEDIIILKIINQWFVGGLHKDLSLSNKLIDTSRLLARGQAAGRQLTAIELRKKVGWVSAQRRLLSHTKTRCWPRPNLQSDVHFS